MRPRPATEFECGAELGDGQRGAGGLLLLFVEAVLASEPEPSPAGPLATPIRSVAEACRLAGGEMHASASGWASRCSRVSPRCSPTPSPIPGDAVESSRSRALLRPAAAAGDTAVDPTSGPDPKGAQPTSDAGRAAASGSRSASGS